MTAQVRRPPGSPDVAELLGQLSAAIAASDLPAIERANQALADGLTRLSRNATTGSVDLAAMQRALRVGSELLARGMATNQRGLEVLFGQPAAQAGGYGPDGARRPAQRGRGYVSA